MPDASTELTDYVLTFGQRYRHETHPTIRNAHPDGVVIVSAHTAHHAHDTVMAWVGREWSDLYPHTGAVSGNFYPRGIVGVLYGDLEGSPDGETRYRVVPGRGDASDEIGPATKVHPEDRPPFGRDGLPWVDEPIDPAPVGFELSELCSCGHPRVLHAHTYRDGSLAAGDHAGVCGGGHPDEPSTSTQPCACDGFALELEVHDATAVDGDPYPGHGPADPGSGHSEPAAGDSPDDEALRIADALGREVFAPELAERERQRAAASRAYAERECGELDAEARLEADRAADASGEGDDPADDAPTTSFRSQWQRDAWERGPRIPDLLEAAIEDLPGSSTLTFGEPHDPDPTEEPAEDPEDVSCTRCSHALAAHEHPSGGRCVVQWGDPAYVAGTAGVRPVKTDGEPEQYRCACDEYTLDPELDPTAPASMAALLEGLRQSIARAAGVDPAEVGVSIPRGEALSGTPADRHAARERKRNEELARDMRRDELLRRRLAHGGTETDLADAFDDAAIPEEDEDRHTPSGTYALLAIRHDIAGLREELTSGRLELPGLDGIERALVAPDGIGASVDALTAAVDGIGASTSVALRYYRAYLVAQFALAFVFVAGVLVALFLGGVIG